MITLESIKLFNKSFIDFENRKKLYDDEAIFNILEYLGLETESINFALKHDLILILLPTKIFKNIDFSSLNIPKKIRFMENYLEEKMVISCHNNLSI